jgi:hypothetical protein
MPPATLPPGTLLAEDARTASTSVGPCAICSSPIYAGHCIARLLTAVAMALVGGGQPRSPRAARCRCRCRLSCSRRLRAARCRSRAASWYSASHATPASV